MVFYDQFDPVDCEPTQDLRVWGLGLPESIFGGLLHDPMELPSRVAGNTGDDPDKLAGTATPQSGTPGRWPRCADTSAWVGNGPPADETDPRRHIPTGHEFCASSRSIWSATLAGLSEIRKADPCETSPVACNLPVLHSS